MVLLNWYSYSLTWLWDGLGKLCEWIFHYIMIPLGFIPDILFIAIIAFLFFLWMFTMKKYYSQHEDKGIIKEE